MDIATAHLRDRDVTLLANGRSPIECSRTKFSYIVSTAPYIEADGRAGRLDLLRSNGMSECFVAAVRKAAENGCWLLRFEQEADVDEELELGWDLDHPEEPE
ncbi:hypothetical protein [Aureimonas sp. Leaf454]|uniref:DUF5983 family protein n=1 Tax=Aureimonas sp. Leaf454 TaxID=1736381 RepID=UPI0012E33881|nr:hypothetical protein [Aureimonas sp. Leaf454]